MTAADVLDDFGDFDEDFHTRPVEEPAIERLMRGQDRRKVAADLGVAIDDLNARLEHAAGEWHAARGGRAERCMLLHLQLDDILERGYEGLASGAYDLAPLLEVLTGVVRLRVDLLRAVVTP